MKLPYCPDTHLVTPIWSIHESTEYCNVNKPIEVIDA